MKKNCAICRKTLIISLHSFYEISDGHRICVKHLPLNLKISQQFKAIANMDRVKLEDVQLIVSGDTGKLNEVKTILLSDINKDVAIINNTAGNNIKITEKQKRISTMFREAGVTDTFLTWKEIKELHNILDDNEIIKYATSGILDNNAAKELYGASSSTLGTLLLVLTDVRILFIDKGLIYGVKVAEIPLDVINSVTYTKGLLFGGITISHSSKAFNVTHVEKETAKMFSDKAREQVKIFKDAPKNVAFSNRDIVVKSVVEQMKEMKELLDLDIITQEEFDLKKKQLLGL